MTALLDDLVKTFGRVLARYESLTRKNGILLAVSGGVDSTALALVAATWHRRHHHGPAPCVAHVDHGVREDSAADAHHVAALAERLALPFAMRRLPPFAGHASESALREGRYAALRAMAEEQDAGLVLTAHTADDDLETVLFRMLRGTGPRGLAGVPEMRPLHEPHVTIPRPPSDPPAGSSTVVLVRPLLEARRRTLEQLLAEAAFPALEDPTNLDLRYSRNWIRHELVPELRDCLGTGLEASLFALKRSARAAIDEIDAAALNFLRRHAVFGAGYRIEIAPCPDEPSLLDAVLVLAHRRLTGGIAPHGPWLARAHLLCHAEPGRRLSGGGPIHLERTRGGVLMLDPTRAGTAPDTVIPLPLGAKPLAFGSTEWRVQAHLLDEAPLSPSPAKAGRLRALITVPGPGGLFLRTRRAGDRFRPLGQTQELLLRRFQQSRHIPRFDRDRLPLVVDPNDRILWAPGAEIAADAALPVAGGPCIEILVRSESDLG